MTILKRWLKRLIKTSLLLLLSLIPLSFFLLGTHTGLNVDLFIIKKISGNALTIQKTQGSVLNKLSLANINYKTKELSVNVKQFNASLSLIKSLTQGLTLRDVYLNDVKINLNNTTSSSSHNDTQSLLSSLKTGYINQTFSPPIILNQSLNALKKLRFNLDNVTIKNLNFQSSTQQHLLHSLRLSSIADGKKISIKSASARMDEQTIELHGTLDLLNHLTTNMTLVSQGKININSTLVGNETHHEWRTKLTKPFNASLNIDFKKDNTFQGALSIKKGFWPLQGAKQISIPNVSLTLEGTPSHYTVEGTGQLQATHYPQLNVSMAAQGSQNQLRLQRMTLLDGQAFVNIKGLFAWAPFLTWQTTVNVTEFLTSSYIPSLPGKLNANFDSHGSLKKATLNTLSQLKVYGTLLNKPLVIEGLLNTEKNIRYALITLGENRLKLHGKNTLPVNIDINFPSLNELHPALSHVHAALTGQGTFAQKSNMTLKLSAGHLQLESAPPLHFKGADLLMTNNTNDATLSGSLHVSTEKKCLFNGKLPRFNPSSLTSQTIDAQLSCYLKDINEIDSFIADLSNSHGELTGNAFVKGLLFSPDVSIDVRLKHGQTLIKALNAQLNNIHLSLTGKPKHYLLSGSAKSGAGILNISGNASLTPSHFASQLSLKGHNVTLLNTDEYKINASPNVTLKFGNKTLLINGAIHIDDAKLNPHDFSSTIELPDDVIVLGNTHQRSSVLNIGYQLNLDLGNDTHLSLEGLKGSLKGMLELDAPIHQLTKATGMLSIRDGTYKAYGQNLNIKQGKLVYAGGPLNNPAMFIQASRTFKLATPYTPNLNQTEGGFSDDMTVGLNITGRLKMPKVTLFSNPSNQSQADILSFLLLGKPLSQSNDFHDDSVENGSQILISALSALNLKGGARGAQLTEQLKHAFGLDNLGIETQRTYNSDTDSVTENTALALSKSLSSKLSLHYSIGLAQGTNILKINYQFSPRWAIQTETNGNTNGVDIIFNYHK